MCNTGHPIQKRSDRSKIKLGEFYTDGHWTKLCPVPWENTSKRKINTYSRRNTFTNQESEGKIYQNVSNMLLAELSKFFNTENMQTLINYSLTSNPFCFEEQ